MKKVLFYTALYIAVSMAILIAVNLVNVMDGFLFIEMFLFITVLYLVIAVITTVRGVK